MFTCSECGEDFKKLSDACRHLKLFHKVHRRRVWNYLIFDEPHSHANVEYMVSEESGRKENARVTFSIFKRQSEWRS